MPRVEFGQFKSDKFDMKFNYELWVPEDLQVKFYAVVKAGKKLKGKITLLFSFKTLNSMTTRC